MLRRSPCAAFPEHTFRNNDRWLGQDPAGPSCIAGRTAGAPAQAEEKGEADQVQGVGARHDRQQSESKQKNSKKK